MKYLNFKLSIIFFIIVLNVSTSQRNNWITLNANNSKQSSTLGNASSSLAADKIKISASSSITCETAQPYWTIFFTNITKITDIKVTMPDTNIVTNIPEIYLVFSKDSMVHNNHFTENDIVYGDSLLSKKFDEEENINFIKLVTDPNNYVICVTKRKFNELISVDTLYTKSITIISPVRTNLEIIELEVIGDEALGPIPPHIGVLGFGSNYEICNDYIDNNNDGFKDCDDYQCRIANSNISFKKPTCPVCADGKIYVTATNVNQISFDGGVTWQSFNDKEKRSFENIVSGIYKIVLKSNSGCTQIQEINMIIPEGISSSICNNGDFEKGTFQGYTFGTAFNTGNPAGPHIFNNSNSNANVHNIIDATNLSDPYVGSFINNPGFLGKFAFKLGDAAVIGNNANPVSQMEKLGYCFTVKDPNFSFNYARVTSDPSSWNNHPDNLLPYFYWELVDEKNTIITSNVELSNDPNFNFFGVVNGDSIRYKGWDCARFDLSAYIDQQVCVNFVNSDCGVWYHWGYTYIDNLCSPTSLISPISKLTAVCSAPSSICGSQDIDIKAEAGGYTSYRWEISQFNASGQEHSQWVSAKIFGAVANIENVVEYYTQNSGFAVVCNTKLKIKLVAMNGCGSNESVVEYLYNCSEYDINYCNPIIYCGNSQEIQILGTNNCNNCTYEWTPSSPLFGPNTAFPTIQQNLNNPGAYLKTYKYVITTPESCKYCGEVSIKEKGFDIKAYPLEVGPCSYNFNLDIILSDILSTLTNESIIVKVTNIINAQIEYIIPIGSGKVRTISKNTIRDHDSQYRIEIQINPSVCNHGSSCKKNYTFNRIPMTSYHAYWKASWPNVFSPNGDGVNDLWHVTLRSLKEINPINCSDMENDKSSIYFLKYKIYDRWGNFMFTSTFSKSISDVDGILGHELTWDGTFNGQPVENGNYPIEVFTESCFTDENFRCQDCGQNQPFQYCFDVDTLGVNPFPNAPQNFLLSGLISVQR